jgi:hypothetical protein
MLTACALAEPMPRPIVLTQQIANTVVTKISDTGHTPLEAATMSAHPLHPDNLAAA